MKCVAKVQPIITVSKRDTSKFLRKIDAAGRQIFSAQKVSDSDIPHHGRQGHKTGNSFFLFLCVLYVLCG